MKPRVVELDVKSQRHERGVGDAPMIGKVAKVSDSDVRSHGSERRKRHLQGKTSPADRADAFVRLMVTGSAVVFVLLIAILILFWTRGWLWNGSGLMAQPDLEPVVQSVEESTPEGAVGDSGVPAVERLSDQMALDLTRRALGARTVSRVTTFFRMSDATSPTEVVSYLDTLDERDGLLSGMDVLEPIESGGHQLGRVVIKSIRGGEVRERLALLVLDEDGEWKVDFEALARVSEPSLDELASGRADGAILRVLAEPLAMPEVDPAGEGFSYWKLRCGDRGDEFVGYCRSSSEQALAMERVKGCDLHDGARRVTLVVQRHAGQRDDRLHISRVIAEDWVVFEEVFDEVVHESSVD